MGSHEMDENVTMKVTLMLSDLPRIISYIFPIAYLYDGLSAIQTGCLSLSLSFCK